MKKMIFLLATVISAAVSFAQDSLLIHSSGNVAFRNSTLKVDSIIFIPTIPDSLYLYESSTVAYKNSLLSVDSITFVKINSLGPTLDGYTYPTVTIGNQVWLAENLRTTKFNDGTPVTLVQDKDVWYNNKVNLSKLPFMCWPNNDSITYRANNYGAIYNWYVVKTGKICPIGWHVPSDAEWTTMEVFLQNNNYNFDGTVDTDNNRDTNNKIAKAIASTTGWAFSSTTGAAGNTDFPAYRNKSGFSGYPAGTRNFFGNYINVGAVGFWYTSTPSSTLLAQVRFINNSKILIESSSVNMEAGCSVRCIKD
jgi:uncharacterized protein (TIGR02145 family)